MKRFLHTQHVFHFNFQRDATPDWPSAAAEPSGQRPPAPAPTRGTRGIPLRLFHAGERPRAPLRWYAPFPVPVGRFPLGGSIRAERPFRVEPLSRKAPLPVPPTSRTQRLAVQPFASLSLVCHLPLAQTAWMRRTGAVLRGGLVHHRTLLSALRAFWRLLCRSRLSLEATSHLPRLDHCRTTFPSSLPS